MDKLDALRYFCVASETLNFRETAKQLSVSPQVISRVIGELETLLGESLFKRNTRHIQLTEFGTQFLPQAKQFLLDEQRLFVSAPFSAQNMRGIVRITVPPLPDNALILDELLIALQPYPDLVIDWQVDLMKLNAISDRIDIGLRIALKPEPDWIVQHIGFVHEKIVASAQLIEQFGMPKDLDDFARRYPLSARFNKQSGRIWHWQINNEYTLIPHEPKFISNDMMSELQATLSGKVCSQLLDSLCQPYVNDGRLIELFGEMDKLTWQLYLYRPYQTMTSAKVLKVFDILTDILRKYYSS